MKRQLIFFLSILFIASLLFFGCTEQQLANAQDKVTKDAYKLAHPCPSKSCNDLNNLNNVITSVFGFDRREYSLECMECAFPAESIKGSYSKVRIDLNGKKVDLSYSEGACAKLGYDCYSEVCISVDEKDSIERLEEVKQSFCEKLESKLDNNSPVCLSQILYDQNTILQKCLRGDFETFDGNSRVFSVIQTYSKCGSFVQRGKINCFD
jgi:hypothetical protein